MKMETKSIQLYGGGDTEMHIEDEYGRRYKVVDKVPADYMIWNNGYFTGDYKTYIPFCKWKHPDDPDNYDIGGRLG